MSRRLVTQLVEALEKLSDTEQTYAALDKADAVIKAAREYLATEPSGERAELIAQIDALFTDITPLPWFGAADGRGVGLSASRWTKNGGFADVTKDSVLRYGGSPITNTHFLAKLANSWPTIRDMLEADAQPKQVTCQIYGHVVGACVECNTHIEAQQAKRVPMAGEQINEMAIQEQFLLVCDGIEELTQIVRATEQRHGITPADKPTDWSAA